MADGRWFPVYYEDLEQNFPEVWDEPRLLWTWARLYVVHDRSWPLPGELPRGLGQAAIDQLVHLGLVELMPKHRFTVRGLDARRIAKRNASRIAAGIRHGTADSNATGNANRLPTRIRQEEDKKRRRNVTGLSPIKEDDLPPFLRVTND